MFPILITLISVLLTLVLTTHEPPSRVAGVWGLGFGV